MNVASKPLVIAHRGASAWLPEHTLPAYTRAIEDGADFIEPDLVLTRDGVLVARHDVELSGTTDVAARADFASRRTQRLVDGQMISGWFCVDFSLAELRTLRAREPLPDLRGVAHDGRYPIPTFEDIVDLAERAAPRSGRLLGIIPEIKHSSWFHALGMDPERKLLDAIERHAYLRKAPLGIQSFEIGNLQRLRDQIPQHSNVFLVQLLGPAGSWPFDLRVKQRPAHSYASMMAPHGLLAVAAYADVVAVHLRQIVAFDPQTGMPGEVSPLVGHAHAAGLRVHAWTLRPENHFLPRGLRCSDDPAERCASGCLDEMRRLLEAGVDGLFTDDPALGRLAVDRHRDPVGPASTTVLDSGG